MELKQKVVSEARDLDSPFNRTRMELKLDGVKENPHFKNLF